MIRKTLNIKRGNVGGTPVTLLLCFQVPDPKQLCHTQFSVAWRVVDFTGKGTEGIKATCTKQLFISNPRIIEGDCINPNIWIGIEPGQKTALIESVSGLSFTTPEQGSDQLVTVENCTKIPQDLAIGFIERTSAIPLLYFPKVKEGSRLSVEFTPILQAYVVSGYQETALLKGLIETKKPIWTQDLRFLPDSTDWVFESDPVTGEYLFTRSLCTTAT